MERRTPDTESPPTLPGRLLQTRLATWLLNLPPIAWLLRISMQQFFRRHLGRGPIIAAPVEKAATASLEATLRDVTEDVVNVLGYVGAMVATYEQGDALPVRALALDPTIATTDDIRRWETKISEFVGQPISITDPNIARVYVYDELYADNLSVKAVMAGGPVISNALYDLFTPIAPPATQSVVDGIQHTLGVQQVIAVPFFLETLERGTPVREVVGNLFAVKRGRITEHDVRVLAAFGRQAAAAIGGERRRLEIELAQRLIFRMQTSFQDEQGILNRIAHWVVDDLGYVGAMVAPYESDDSLAVYALHINPAVASPVDIRHWEQQLSELAGRPLNLADVETARVYVRDTAYQDNLSTRAAQAGEPVTSNDIYDLFRPIAPLSTHTVLQTIQQQLGIQQVIAVPFFLEVLDEGETQHELFGNLFAATRSHAFQASEIALLRAVGQQAAVGIRNARLYRRAEEQRIAAQMFGRMAFSAAKSVHALRNHIGTFQLHLNLVEALPPEARAQQIATQNAPIHARLTAAANILDTLREPWRQITDECTDVNDCMRNALGRALSQEMDPSVLNTQLELSPEPLLVKLSPDMLTEAFRLMIHNALDAIQERGVTGQLRLSTRQLPSHEIEAMIGDNGSGIRPENLRRIFDIGWTTKSKGMGFGLFWARDYIEGLGGSIQVESVLDQGTTFTLRLPESTSVCVEEPRSNKGEICATI